MSEIYSSIEQGKTDKNIRPKIAKIHTEIIETKRLRLKRNNHKNSRKCKLLFSKRPFLWHNNSILFSGVLVKDKLIFVTHCADSCRFSREVLRSSALAFAPLFPSAAIAVSKRCGELAIIAESFSKKPLPHSALLLAASVPSLDDNSAKEVRSPATPHSID